MRSFLIMALFSACAFAQSPQLLVTANPGDKPHPIALAKADIGVQISGHLSQTTMTLTFSNDADRVLEGELVFPLPEGATVCAYALDVGGQLVDAVVVEKEKARVVFETEVRKGIDPGLIEKVSGNNFRTRIYPIPARGNRTIRVVYVSDLTGGNDSSMVYALPLKWDKPVAKASIKLEVIGSTIEPKVDAEGLAELAIAQRGGNYVSEKQIDNATFNMTLSVTLPAVPATVVSVEKRSRSAISIENLDPKAAEQFARTDHFFLLSHQPKVLQAIDRLTRKPQRIAIAWDASMSRATADHTREFKLIKEHLKSLGDVWVEVIPFRNLPGKHQSFRVKGGDSAEVIKFLSQVIYDGGTALSAMAFEKDTPSERRETLPAIAYYMLFTDGLSNLGPDLPTRVEVPVFAISADANSNHNVLRYLSSSSGGQYINLERMTDEQAAAAFSQDAYSLLSVEFNNEDLSDVLPVTPQPVQGRVTVAGKLLSRNATITLCFGSRMTGIQQRVPVSLTQEHAAETGMVPRYWAQMKLADLSVMQEKNELAITSLGKDFGLVTPFTSMLVLETVEQYLQHKIVPPRSRADVYAQFMQRIEQQRSAQAAEETAKIDRVLAMWNARVKWWEQEFKYAADFKYREEAKTKVQSPRGDTTTTGAAPSGGRGGTATPSTDERVPVDLGEMPRPVFSGTPRPGRPMNSPTPREDASRSNGERDPRAFIGAVLADTEKEGKGNGKGGGPAIAIKEWSPDTPYLKALKAAKPEDAYAIYSDQSKTLRASPAFYLDCADYFASAGNKELALRILTNIPELGLEDGRLLRIAAHRLAQLGYLDLAADLFEKVTRLRPEEPQSFRDLALVLADRAARHAQARDTDRARSDYQRSLQLLHKVVMTRWDRFEEIEVIALMDANRVLIQLSTQDSALRTINNPFDPRLIKLLELDVRILLTWDTDNTDVDLHVLEPSGETCFYGHNRTTIGAAMSRDFTQGYGPEEYCLRKLMPGKYTIKCHFYGNRDQKLVGPTTVQATVITNWGKPNEQRRAMTLRLADPKEMVEIGTVTLQP